MLHSRFASRCRPILRHLHSLESSSLTPSHSIYVSSSTNPYFNLSFEDWLFRHKNPKDPLLLLYRDDPCVVIGRNQNPWKEVNLSASQKIGIPWIRRRSGGGTVYHDLGNTNFSIHLPRSSFDRHLTAQERPLRQKPQDMFNFLHGMTTPSCIDMGIRGIRVRICLQDNVLGDLLHTNKDTMQTKGVPSVRSPVRNLQSYSSTVTHEAFVHAVISSFRTEYSIDEEPQYVEETESTCGIEYISKGMKELPSWDWAFGQTPEFTYPIARMYNWGTVTAKLHSKHGIILDCLLDVQSGDSGMRGRLDRVSERLKGQKYGFLDVGSEESDSVAMDVLSWLEAEMSV